jgi:hypothetical protein
MLERAASALKRLFGKRSVEQESTATPAVEAAPRRQAAPAPPPRPTRRPSDIGVDVLNRTYTPSQASGKAGFRSDGADHGRDQEFATGASLNDWNDEDRFTNKSHDPRIGTHGRTYEPGESRDTKRSE